MGIKRYIANADNTITNAFDGSYENENRATGSNMGRSDILEVFSIYAQVSGSQTSDFPGESQELSRLLLQFPTGVISSDRTAGLIPASGSVSFFLRMFNARHGQTLPRNYTMTIQAVSRSWEEGDGLDMDNYTDKTYGQYGSNWVTASQGVAWSSVGGDYHSSPSYTVNFGEKGTEDIKVDISQLVEEWIAGTKQNYGLGVRLSSQYEAYFSSSVGGNTGSIIHNTSGAKRSYYTKKFFARESEFFFRRPIIEAQWDNSKKDDRGDFYYSSSLAPASENLNTLYLYNYIRGRLRNIPAVGTGNIYLSLYSGSATGAPTGARLQLPQGGGVPGPLQTVVTGGYVSTGVYSASFAVTGGPTIIDGLSTTAPATLNDVWHYNQVEFNTGSIVPKYFDSVEFSDSRNYVVNIKNMKPAYSPDETARLRLFVRQKNWNPNIYTIANANPQTLTIPSASYKVIRIADNYEVIPYGTASTPDYTQLSYDVSGNYFNLDMSLLQPGYMYGIKLAFYDDAVLGYREQKSLFKFRVEEDNDQ